MGYQTNDGRHEGWGAAEFPDGRFSVGSEGTGAMVRLLGPDLDADAGRGILDGRTAIGWRSVCTCGWRGPLWQRVTDPAEHDPAAHKIYDPAPSRWGDVPSGVTEDAIYREWLGHLPPTSLADVRSAAEDAREAQDRLAGAVQRARDDGRSWAEIGDAAGVTRQSAHERWGKTGTRRLSGLRVSQMTDDEVRQLAGAGPARHREPAAAWQLVDLDREAGREDTGR